MTSLNYCTKTHSTSVSVQDDSSQVKIEVNGEIVGILSLDSVYEFVKTAYNKTTLEQLPTRRRKLQMEYACSPKTLKVILKRLEGHDHA